MYCTQSTRRVRDVMLRRTRPVDEYKAARFAYVRKSLEGISWSHLSNRPGIQCLEKSPLTTDLEQGAGRRLRAHQQRNDSEDLLLICFVTDSLGPKSASANDRTESALLRSGHL